MTPSRDAGQSDIAPVAFLPGVREADEQRAENISMHALGRRGMSRAEVVDLLQRREIDPIVIESEIERLESVALVNDEQLATDLVERLRDRKKLGPSAIRSELMRREIDRSAIDAALAEHDDEADADMLETLAVDRARRLSSLDRATAERRLIAYLQRKGHGGSAARDAARRALDGSGRSGGASRVEFR